MAGKKGQREWGSVRRQTTKSARYQASFVGPDLRRHFAPVTFESRLNAERWLMREKEIIERCAVAGESWSPPGERKTAQKAQALAMGQYAKDWISQRKLKPRTRILYESLWANHCDKKLGKVPVRD